VFAEFNKFVADQAAENGINADLLGARIIGRWKSGAPIDLAPTQDDPALAADPHATTTSTLAILIRTSALLFGFRGH
jgi:hypothetical protein